MNVLYWPSIINYQLLPLPILTQYTASSSRNAQLRQLDLVAPYLHPFKCHVIPLQEESHKNNLLFNLLIWASFIHTKQIFKLSKLIFLSNGNKYVAIISSRSLIKIGNLNCSKLAKHCKSQRREGKARQMQPILDFATADSLCATYGWRDLEVVMTHINFRTIFSFLFSKLSPNWC